MAATGYTPIQLYYSSTTTNVPLAANLANGELALNIVDGKFFYKNGTGQIVSFAGSGGSTNSFATINSNNSILTAISNNSTLTFRPGIGIGITSDIINDIITIDSYASYNLAQAAFGKANSISIGSGFFVPLFFVVSGVTFNLPLLLSNLSSISQFFIFSLIYF